MAANDPKAGPDGAAGAKMSAGGLSGPAPAPAQQQEQNVVPGKASGSTSSAPSPAGGQPGQAGATPDVAAAKQVVGAGGTADAAVGKAGAAGAAAGGAGAAGGASKVAGGAGGALGAVNVAQDAQNLKNDPNAVNALRVAGAVDKRAAVAAEVLDKGQKGKEALERQIDSTKDDADALKDAKKDGDASPKMGAGGTSAAREEKPTDGSVGKKVAVAGAGAGAVGAGPVVALLMFLNWLKSLFMAMMQMVMGWLASLLAMVMNVVGAVVGFFTAVGSAVSGFLGGAVSVTTAATASFSGFLAGALVLVMAVTGYVSNNEAGRKDVPMQNCVANVQQIQTSADISNQTEEVQTEANARKIYAIFGGMGMSDVNIAGILGNWTAESGIDATAVETIYDEFFTIGPRKQGAQAVGFRIKDFAPAYAAKYPLIEHAGIGLGQWTNDRHLMLIQYSMAMGKPWYDMEVQLGFMVSKDDPYRVQMIKDMITTPAASVDAATLDFMNRWEGLPSGNIGDRQAAAAKWYAKFASGWTKDKALADSIIAQSGAAVVAGNTQAVSQAMTDCRGAQKGVADNSSLAMAALSYAWPTRDQGMGNDGTPLYQELMRHIFPGDPYFMSCDRGVATAVRWSGTDDTFPIGAVQQQLAYLETSPKWTEVQWGGDNKNLQPGDIIIRWDGGPPSSAGGGGGVQHIELYVGHDLVQKVFAEKASPEATNVSASFGSRSPGATNWYTGGSSGLNTYRAFRSTGPEAAPKYKSYVPTASPIGNVTVGTGGSIPAPGGVTYPLKAGTYSLGAYFGKTGSWARYHTGQDFPAPTGTPVYAAAGGTVLYRLPNPSGWAGPEYVAIQHGSSGTTLYAHLDTSTVSPGQTVVAGQQIGTVGNKGRSFGSHLHFEYYPPGVQQGQIYEATNPMTWLASQGAQP